MTTPLVAILVLGALVVAPTGRSLLRFERTTPTRDPADSPIPAARLRAPPRQLPAEGASAADTRFSFMVSGDTRGRNDGQSVQVEQGVVVDAMLCKIDALNGGPDAVRFVWQRGDAAVDARPFAPRRALPTLAATAPRRAVEG